MPMGNLSVKQPSLFKVDSRRCHGGVYIVSVLIVIPILTVVLTVVAGIIALGIALLSIGGASTERVGRMAPHSRRAVRTRHPPTGGSPSPP